MLVYRYLARAIIIPFVYDAPPVTVDTLDNLLKDAPSALPEIIQIGKYMKNMTTNYIYKVVKKIEEVTRRGIDGRLVMQYALCIVCTQEVNNDN